MNHSHCLCLLFFNRLLNHSPETIFGYFFFFFFRSMNRSAKTILKNLNLFLFTLFLFLVFGKRFELFGRRWQLGQSSSLVTNVYHISIFDANSQKLI
jgi:hypothetical protein